MNQRQRNQWAEAAKGQVMRNAKQADICGSELMALYDECAGSLEKEIRAFYGKYAGENGLTEPEASKLLTGKEYSTWRRTLEGYLKEAALEGKGSRTLLELNTLAAKSQVTRKELLLSNIYRNMASLSGQSEKELAGLLSGLVKTNYEHKAFDIQKVAGATWNVAKVDERLLKQILDHPWSGKSYSKALWDDTDKLAALARRELTLGFMSGSSVDKMAKEIGTVMGKGRNAAQRLVRTEASYFANQGQMLAYRDAGVEKYRFLGGGCEVCQRLDGQVFSISEARPGENLPPIHPNCKCTTVPAYDVPVFKRREGDPLKGNPKFEEWKRKHVSEKGLAARVSMEGEPEHEEKKLVGKVDLSDAGLVKSELKRWTDEIRKDQEKENAVVITASGDIYRCFGTKGNVYPNSDLGAKLAGAYVTHNHPDTETRHSFSADDLSLFFTNRLKELHGTDSGYDYKLVRTEETRDCDADTVTHLFQRDYYHKALDEAFEQMAPLEDDGYHEIVGQFAREYGFQYERTRR